MDAVVVTVTVAITTLMFFDSPDTQVSGRFAPSYQLLSAVLAVAWMVALGLGRTRERRAFGFGPTEYARVFSATVRVFGLVAIGSYLLKWQVGRGYLLVALPLGSILLVASRYLQRQLLHRQRANGQAKSTVLVIGPRDKAATLIAEFHDEPSSEFRVVGVCVPDGVVMSEEVIRGVPVLGGMDSAAQVAGLLDVHTVAVAGADKITSKVVRQLGWDLEGSGIELALTTTLLDVAGPRMTLTPMNAMPLIYVDEPRFSGSRYLFKSAFDWVGAAVITLLASPVLLVLAVAVKVTSKGPVFYVQKRIGKDGRTFGMLKFRSMVVGAHDQLAAVLAAEGVDEVTLFYKPKNDPRVTPLGRFIRKYSLDELPQLLNVLKGDMSLVGPRPQIADEVKLYDDAARRRLLVRPGLTGLWQVSGRSALAPEQAIRLDVRYAENWSLFGDLSILARTAKAMVTGDGAR